MDGPSIAVVATSVSAIIISVVGPLLLTSLQGKQRIKERAEDYKRQDEVAARLQKVEEERIIAAKNTETKINEIVKVGAITHSLVNSAMGVQLKINAVALKRLAELTNDPKDIEAADLAEIALQQHLEKQEVLDNKVIDKKIELLSDNKVV